MHRLNLKVALILGSLPSSGGSFAFEQKFLGILEELSGQLGFELRVFLARAGTHPQELKAEKFADIALPYWEYRRNFESLFSWARRGFRSLVSAGEFEQYLSNEGINLVIFGSLNRVIDSFSELPFFLSIWDLGHRDLVDFPEFRGREWASREARLWKTLPRASRVLVDSTETGHRLSQIYGVDARRVSRVGLLFDGFESIADEGDFAVPDDPYFIYPAKAWAHKNHPTLLEAFALVVREIPNVKLVLTGAQDTDLDKNLLGIIERAGISHSVITLGYVDESVLALLIRSAVGLVMPTLLGPTNIPPLQALSLGTPAIVSDVHHYDEGINDKLAIVERDDVRCWAREMIRILIDRPRLEPVLFSNDFARESISQALSEFIRAHDMRGISNA